MKKQRVIAAIDFGTHGTGFAWTTIDDRHKDARRRQVWFRTRWPDHPTPYPKNLTALLLNDADEIVSWGYEARRRWTALSARGEIDGHEYISSFKMSLAAEKDEGTQEIEGGKLSAERSRKLIAAFLTRIKIMAVEEINKSGFSDDEIRWCLTVPAIWNDYQKQVMREAAVEAGLPDEEARLQLVLEPEAAAYHARVSGVRTVRSSGRRPNLMSKGSRFLVADCGGGTVDITAYRTDQQNRLEEIGRECGGKYGSEYVNQAFLERILAKRLGSYDAIEKVFSVSPYALLDLLDAWEKAKVSITTALDADIVLPLPAALDRQLDEAARKSLGDQQDGITDFVIVRAAEAREAFDCVLPGILDLVDRQLDEMRLQRRNIPGREIVVLVGGFGNSPYLQERLQDHLSGRADVLIPPDPQVAVLLGAVHYTYDPQTRSRRAKYTYGCDSASQFREGIDPEEYRIELPDGRMKCDNRFSLHVAAGQSIGVNEVSERVYSPLHAEQESVIFKLYTSTRRGPQYTTDPGCVEVGSVSVDISEVMDLSLDERSIVLAMKFGEVQVGVTATVQATGKSVNARLDFKSMGP